MSRKIINIWEEKHFLSNYYLNYGSIAMYVCIINIVPKNGVHLYTNVSYYE